MITKKELQTIIKEYGKDVTIGSLGGHSALDVCRGAKDEGLRTVVVCQKGREKTYTNYYKSRNGVGVVDEVIVVDKFSDIVKEEVQKKLQQLNTVFVHSRYFWVYCDIDKIENNFKIPFFGTRQLVKKEERHEENNQYFLLDKAGIKTPQRFENPKDIDRLVLVKVAEAARVYERAFFFAASYDEYVEKSKQLLDKITITEDALKRSIIEEFVVGALINFNFFYSPLTKKVELLGTDIRRQTNIDGLLRLTAPEQNEVLKHNKVKYIETGHIAVTVKESLLEKAYEAAEKFVKATQKHYPPGIIGPFALQGAIIAGPPKEEFVVFDVSMRIPGSPGTRYTPYMNYVYGQDVSVGRRIAMEIKKAVEEGKLLDIVT
ncbi:5-formaminoimidazole-4-carboxamide-1-(beta)-D-ribofuranosyl 5'-monophosphate synthetase [Candidatus Woesearchaeota archaeon]|nr:5-formaminoimidazole-4-carboxamide-1-(beta)-D-ribofuranosyl 5'-monophosphate synthetase [Candidatus Woesearchaeota archaeon]|tara:strand:+ start:30958 stop:32082 length:1125 start_codon:yes stop_codon:yes gene_type:complete